MNPDPSPLDVALSASRPIDDAPRQPLAVEMLLTESQRRTVSVAEHEAFRESLAPRPAVDPIDELLGELRAAELERGRDQ
jgi:hypothetical protein